MAQSVKKANSIWNVEEHSGLIPVEGADPKKLKMVRLWNFLEPVITYGLILLVVWVSMLDESLLWMWATLGGMLIWLLILSPMVHYKFEKDIFLEKKDQNIWFYFFDCRGLGSARRYYFSVDGEEPYIKKYKKEILLTLAFIGAVFALALVNFSEEYGEELVNLGIADTTGIKILVAAVLIPIVLAVLGFLGFPLMVRFETLKKSSKQILWSFVLGVPMILVFTFIFYLFPDLPHLTNDTVVQKLAEFTILEYFGQFAGYIFWGYLQQLLFLTIFSTMFTRAFDIQTKKGKLLAALCSSLFFGLIHLPEFWLSLFTWIAGFMWALIFMSSKNLWVMGLSHGSLATLLCRMAPVPFTVGPASV